MKYFLVAFSVFWNIACDAAGKLNVIASTPDLGSIARVVGGDRIDLTVVAKPTEDPHFVEARPSFIVKMSKADLLIEGGADLESAWLKPLTDGARNAKINPGGAGRIVCSEGLKLLEVPVTLDRSKGDIHALGNPHYLMDPANAKLVAEKIGAGFARADPKSALFYKERVKAFSEELESRMETWKNLLLAAHGKRLVAYHNTWPYFSAAFGVKIDIFLEPKPGIPPTPSHLAQTIVQMKTEKVAAIIVEPYQNRRTAEKVGQETGARVLMLAQYPGGVRGTEAGYIANMEHIVRQIASVMPAPVP